VPWLARTTCNHSSQWLKFREGLLDLKTRRVTWRARLDAEQRAAAPALIAQADAQKGFVLKAAGMMCKDLPDDRSKQDSPEACNAKAQGMEWDSFAFKPSWFYQGGDCLIFTKECTEWREDEDANTYGKEA